MSKEVEMDLINRNRSHSDNNKRHPGAPQKNAFSIAGKLVLDYHLSNRSQEGGPNLTENSLQLMKKSTVTTKLTKIPDFVHLPKVEFDEMMNYHSMSFQSEPDITSFTTPLKQVRGAGHEVLVEEQKHSIIF
jgi:hypothetical protein